ncbi:Formate dehydrogenase-O iron-sulfur subunit [Amycolatopsis sp. M39]|nr:Formate dehydrogenase-O iron-sulfur subunit [Amycolatopsis sp. M39]
MGGLDLLGMSYDNTGDLGANTWRHVAFIEQPKSTVDLGMPAVGAAEQEDAGVRWLMSSDVCKHCTHAACLDVCPTGALFRTEFDTVVVQQDICNGCGYCVPACPDETGPGVRAGLAGADAELVAEHHLETGLGLTSEPYRTGRAGKLLKAAKALTATGMALSLAARCHRVVGIAAREPLTWRPGCVRGSASTPRTSSRPRIRSTSSCPSASVSEDVHRIHPIRVSERYHGSAEKPFPLQE